MAPRDDLLTAAGWAVLDDWPPWLRDDPTARAVAHVTAREAARMEEFVEVVRRQAFPALADVLLGGWERRLGLPAEPPGRTLAERRETVVDLLRSALAAAEGASWETTLQRVAPGAVAREHDPADPGSPPPYTVLVEVPFPPDSDRYRLVESVLGASTPAVLDLVLSYVGGFLLDRSQLDQEPL